MQRDAGSGGREEDDNRGWILRCQGWSVYGPDGYVGTVVEVLYDYSARWDRPAGLKIRTDRGDEVSVAIEEVAGADESRRTLHLRRASNERS